MPTHLDGRSLYWEFATDGYDIGFGLFFEWVDPEDTQVRHNWYSFSLTYYLLLQVTVHISDSEDDSEEYITDEEREEGEEGDPEMQAGRSGLSVETGPPTSCIIPTYRWINPRESELSANPLFSSGGIAMRRSTQGRTPIQDKGSIS